MTLQYEQKTVNDQPELGSKVYLFDAASATQTDVVFNNWATLLNVMSTVTGKKEILFAALVTTIPSGTYDMTDITLVGANAVRVVVVDDVVLQNLDGSRNIGFSIGISANTVSTFQISGGATPGMQFTNCRFSVGSLATVPMFDITGASTLTVFGTHTEYSSIVPGVPVFAVGAGSTLTMLQASTASGSGGNNYGGLPGEDPFVSGAGTITIRKGSGEVYFSGNQAPATPTVTLVPDYGVAVTGDWTGADPTSLAAAVDRIAAALGPIA